MNDIVNFRFLVPLNTQTEIFLQTNIPECYYSSDGSPFCKIYEGFLVKKNDVRKLPHYLNFEVYEISDRFLDTSDFLSDFLDGDCEDDDFILEDYE